MTIGQEPVAGKLYRCALKHGTTRICRYGYHRKNNDRNWDDPPAGSCRPSCLWYGLSGWRSRKTPGKVFPQRQNQQQKRLRSRLSHSY